MIYLKAYIVALCRLLVISGFGLLLSQLVGITDQIAIFFLYVSVAAAVAGPIGVAINRKNDAK